MLITSVLQILDSRQLETKVWAPAGSGEFHKWLESASNPLSPGDPVKQDEPAALAKPLPGGESDPVFPAQRGIGEFMRTLEEVTKENRSPIVDVFE